MEKEFGFREISLQIPALHSPTTGCCVFVTFVAFSFFLPTAWCWKASGLHFLTFSFHLHSFHRCSHPVPTDDLYLKHQPLLWTPDWYTQHLLNITALMSNRGKTIYTQNLIFDCCTHPKHAPPTVTCIPVNVNFLPSLEKSSLSPTSSSLTSLFQIWFYVWNMCVDFYHLQFTILAQATASVTRVGAGASSLLSLLPSFPPYRLFSTKHRMWFFGHV